MYSKEIKVTKNEGVSNKDAAQIVQHAMRYQDSDIFLEQKNKRINAKSIMGVISLGLKNGDTLIISANGTDAVEAVNDISSLLEEKSDY